MKLDYDTLLAQVKKQEELLQFDTFNNRDAWEIGNLLVQKAQKENLKVSIDISRNGHQLFHYAMEGTSPSNDSWIKRKMNVVALFSHSSYYIGLLYEKKGSSIYDADALPAENFAAHGGSFPIILKNTGVIGTITVSGLPSEEDHQMIVVALQLFLKVTI
ncbi:MAG: heme-degrading domain-containing protein [Clostridia bacterium]|nr:heme-degrading domain-containing protein [Clostridia bacterium]